MIDCIVSALSGQPADRRHPHAGARLPDEADSKLPVLGYTVPYALGNILLTAWGPVIVMLTR